MNRQVILLPSRFDAPWEVVSEQGPSTIVLDRFDFRGTTNAAQVFRFCHPEWPPSAEGYISVLAEGIPTINPVLSLTDKPPASWQEWLASFDSPFAPSSAKLILCALLKIVSRIAANGGDAEVTVVMPPAFTPDDVDLLADQMTATAAVALFDAHTGTLLKTSLKPSPTPWLATCLCAHAVENDRVTGSLKPRRSADNTPLGHTSLLAHQEIWPVFLIDLRRAEVPYLTIKGFFFSLELSEKTSHEHENASRFSRSLVRIFEGTVYVKEALDDASIAKIRSDFCARAGELAVALKDDRVRSLLTPDAERALPALGIETAVFADKWSVIQEKPDLLQGTLVYQSSVMGDPPTASDAAATKAGQGETTTGEIAQDLGENSENRTVASDEHAETPTPAKHEDTDENEPPQNDDEQSPRAVEDTTQGTATHASCQDDDISVDAITVHIAEQGDDGDVDTDTDEDDGQRGDEDADEEGSSSDSDVLGDGPWLEDVERIYAMEQTPEWQAARDTIDAAITDEGLSPKDLAKVIRDTFKRLIEDGDVVGYPALTALIEGLGFTLVDCSKSHGPTIYRKDSAMEPVLLGYSAKRNVVGGSSHHAQSLMERHQHDFDRASRYLEWAAAHPIWGPEKHYLEHLSVALDSFIVQVGPTRPISPDPIGLFLRLTYFRNLPSLRPAALGDGVLISSHLAEIADLPRPPAEDVDEQRAAAATLWKRDLKNGRAFLPREKVPSDSKETP